MKLTRLLLCAMVGFVSLPVLASEYGIQLALTRSIYVSHVAVTSHDDESDYLRGDLIAHGVEGYYAFSRYVQIGAGYHQIHDCIGDSLETGLKCQMDRSVSGSHISLLAGYNLNGDGLFIYTGTRYFWEWNHESSLGSLVIPAGIGFRFLDISIEASTELRDDYADFGYFGMFSTDPRSDYYLDSYGDYATVSSMPFKFSLGYQF